MYKIFPCKFPVIEAWMYCSSSVELAVAVAAAGCFPSLSAVTQDSPVNESLDVYLETKKALQQYKNITGNTDVILTITQQLLREKQYMNLFKEFSISHVEILPSANGDKILSGREFFDNVLNREAIKYLRNFTKIILRIYEPIDSEIAKLVDAVAIKGQESAGRTGSWKVKDLFIKQKELTPNLPIIPYGGISSPDQVLWYMNNGAEAVGVGTLFAMSAESPLSTEVKKKLINTSRTDILMRQDTKQNCVFFSDPAADDPDWNRTQELQKGIKGDGSQGLIYIGHGIVDVEQILPVKDIVSYLCSKLDKV
jgi:hypothetical protein